MSTVNEMENFTPLTKVVRQNQLSLVRALVEIGHDINEFDGNGYTPLQTAAFTRNDEILKFLIDSGADITLCSVDNLPPLQYACLNNSIEFVQLLVDRGADVNNSRNVMTPLICAIIGDGLEIVRLLVSHGANVNFTVRDVASPLVAAMMRLNGGIALNRVSNLRPIDRLRMDIVQCLIDAGADRRLLRVLERYINFD